MSGGKSDHVEDAPINAALAALRAAFPPVDRAADAAALCDLSERIDYLTGLLVESGIIKEGEEITWSSVLQAWQAARLPMEYLARGNWRMVASVLEARRKVIAELTARGAPNMAFAKSIAGRQSIGTKGSKTLDAALVTPNVEALRAARAERQKRVPSLKSQAAFARWLRVGKTTLRRIEGGEKMTLGTMRKIAERLNLDVETIILQQ